MNEFHTRAYRPLYPTTFRWNFAAGWPGSHVPYLYIPLRSDETIPAGEERDRKEPLYPTTFRWNPSPESTVDFPFPPLYPTTFRWNEVESQSAEETAYDFISHYVQMKRTSPRSP